MHDFGSSYMDYVCAIPFHAYIYLNLILYMVHDAASLWTLRHNSRRHIRRRLCNSYKHRHVSAKSMLLDLVENQIGVQEKQSFEFNDGDRLRAAILCLQRGATVDDVASNLNWKDFEGLASEILDEAGFATIRNFIMKDPRREIDVIGIKMGVAMLIDCKHWKRTPVSALTDAASKHVACMVQ